MNSRSICTGRVMGDLTLSREDSVQFYSVHGSDGEGRQRSIQVERGSSAVGGAGDTKNGVAQSVIGYEEPIMLTQSTHSFLFTEPTCSFPFAVAVGIIFISYLCLFLALYNNIYEDYSPGNRLNVPVGVPFDVRVAQYVALLIGLIMEEEIPESFYLLRMISKTTLREGAPALKYRKFVFCSFARILMGYLFYFNIFVVVVQATEVIDIFYDVLALQFLQQIDDIAFRLAKWDVFGKKLKRASTRKCFRVEFEKLPFARRKKMSRFVKILYMFNFIGLMAGMSIIAFRQGRGQYHCHSITVHFDDHIWENAIVLTSNGGTEKMDLIYSYFSGVYVLNETIGFHDRRPIYTEQNKFDDSEYEEKIGAQIMYCKEEGAWVFMHLSIRKDDNARNPDCPWLLRSPDTKSFNLLEVPGDWSVWTGIIKRTSFEATCNGCDLQSEADCNYHGTCVSDNSDDGKCDCDLSEDDGYPLYFGQHCEFLRPCIQIIGALGTGVWNIVPIKQRNEDKFTYWRNYGRGVYIYRDRKNGTLPGLSSDFEEDDLLLMYSGSRWFGTYYKGVRDLGHWLRYAREFHAFWDRVYKENTHYVSNPTTRSDPIAVDFFQIERRGEKYGPLGELLPLSYPPGSGYFECRRLNVSIHDFASKLLEDRGDNY